MNKLVAELREFGSVTFSDDAHAVWLLHKYEFKFDLIFEDIAINTIGCRLLTFKYQDKLIDMKGQYIIKQKTSTLLKISLDDLYSRDTIDSENFCEAFIEFRLHDEYTSLLKHERYMNFLETPIGGLITAARNWHDEMCAHGYIPRYNGKIMSASGKLDGYDFKFDLLLDEDLSEATITYLGEIYKYKYSAGTTTPALDVVKKFISMVNS